MVKNEIAIKRNQKVSTVVGIVDSLDIAAIFGMFLTSTLHVFLETIGKYFMFPIAALASVIQAMLAWRQAQLSGWKSRGIVGATVETLGAIAITTAVGLGITASILATFGIVAAFGGAAPIIFAAVLGGKTLYHAGATAYYTTRALTATLQAKRTEYKELAKGHGVATLVTGLATGAVIAVMLFGKWALAGLGIAAGVVGASYGAYKGYKLFTKPTPDSENNKKDDHQEASSEQKPLSQNARVAKRLGKSPSQERLVSDGNTATAKAATTLTVVTTPVAAMTPAATDDERANQFRM